MLRGSRFTELLSVMAVLAPFLFGQAVWADSAAPAPRVAVDNDGTIHIPAISVPVSEYLSPEGKAYLAEHLKATQHPEMMTGMIAGYVTRQRARYPVQREDTHIAGVHVFVYAPKDGIAPANAKRILIELHGGAFRECWPACAELESIPIAAVGHIKVVALDYRQAPAYHFPAASEDVAAVYTELLKTYRAQDIGIYGCSAGGMLTGMAAAWFQQHDLPQPGAIGIFCAGLTLPNGKVGGGDSMYTAMPLGEGRLSFPVVSPGGSDNYLAGVDPGDPLVAPAVSPKVLAGFPPTLFITGTRGMELSSAVYSHSLLVRAGVDAELHVWEGMFHGFFYNPDVPESRDCYNVIVNFFDRHLGGS